MAAHPPVPKHIHKRRDYDLSFQGIPIFEFSSSDLFTTACGLEFLSVEGIGPWYDADQFVEYGKEEYAEVVRAWEDAGRDLCWDSDDELDRVGGGGEGEESRLGLGVGGVRGSRIREMPAPNRGVWWEVFYKRMYGDCRVWERVKTSMGRSNCRVVVRWVERESTEDDESGLDTGGVGESGRGRWRALKGKERMAAGKHARMTRSQTRSRSALALGGESSSGIVIGVGESARSRALGNKDLTKAKVRKR
jgi:hypothetical protein